VNRSLRRHRRHGTCRARWDCYLGQRFNLALVRRPVRPCLFPHQGGVAPCETRIHATQFRAVRNQRLSRICRPSNKLLCLRCVYKSITGKGGIPLMADQALSLQGRQQAVQAMRRRLAITLVAALVLIGGGWITLWAAGERSPAVAPAAHPFPASGVSRRPSDELLETTKGLQVTQQQAVDQLQVVQDQLVAQRAETKRLSDQIAALTERFDALQQSIANLPAPSTAAGPASAPHPKSH
jgi:uncharacterized coiled-coil protein SlyX